MYKLFLNKKKKCLFVIQILLISQFIFVYIRGQKKYILTQIFTDTS